MLSKQSYQEREQSIITQPACTSPRLASPAAVHAPLLSSLLPRFIPSLARCIVDYQPADQPIRVCAPRPAYTACQPDPRDENDTVVFRVCY